MSNEPYQPLTFRGTLVLPLDTLLAELVRDHRFVGWAIDRVVRGVHDSVLVELKPEVHPALRVSEGL